MKEGVTWVIVIALILVTSATIFVVSIAINGLQQNASVLHHAKVASEGLARNKERFVESPMPPGIAADTIIGDAMSDEPPSPERAHIVVLSDAAQELLDRGKIDQSLQKYTECVQYLRMLERRGLLSRVGTTDFVASMQELVYATRGYCFMHQKQYQKGIDDLTDAIRLKPSSAINYKNRAEAYRILGKEALARSDLKKAKECEQTLPE